MTYIVPVDGALTLTVGRRIIPVSSIEDASARFAALRDEAVANGEGGASAWPDGAIRSGVTFVARVSYNAKVWASPRYVADDTLLFNPYEETV